MWRLRIAQFFFLCMVALGFTAIAFGKGPFVGLALFAAFLVAVAWWTLFVLPRRRVRETAEGLHTWDIGFPVRRLAKWSEIERFEEGAFPGKQVLVVAVRRRGLSLTIAGIDAAAVTSWDGPEPGSTDDIISELNRRLVLWRRELGLPGPSTPEGRRIAEQFEAAE